MNDEFENALAWFTAAPNRWLESAKKDLSACAEWVWEVLQGDFHDNASTAQVVTGTVISMIPFVDQICDVRDVVANCKKIDNEPERSWHWVLLVLTLLGLFPTLGSLVKGCGKIVFASLRKAGHVSGATPEIVKAIDQAIVQLNKFLARPEVIKTLKALKIDNVYKYLAKEFRRVAAMLNPALLTKAFEKVRDAVESLLSIVKKWGGESLANRAGQLLRTIDRVRQMPDKWLAGAVKPVQDMLNQVARRLDIEADMAHRAHLNAINPHAFSKVSAADQEAAFKKNKPSWVDVHHGGDPPFPAMQAAPIAPPGWTTTALDPTGKRRPLSGKYDTFHTMDPVLLPPGTTIYRILDPTSADNSLCWMSKAEFDQLRSKAQWRRRFAVWAEWNSNGEFVTYVVPPGPGLHVWEGVTASQLNKSETFVLQGGARQIVVDPNELKKSHLGKRQPTTWKYDDLGNTNDLIGVPVLKNNWYEKK